MSRINTNVSSLIAQSRLNRTNNDLQTSLTRLSTGLRINSAKDDPAGLLASEALRSDITSLNKAISNTKRATQIVATADSALGQVSNLLNNMRGLIVEAANSGGLSDSEIAANLPRPQASGRIAGLCQHPEHRLSRQRLPNQSGQLRRDWIG
jgi:flagellin